MPRNNLSKAPSQPLAFGVVGIKVVDFDQRGDGALIGGQDEVEIASPTLRFGEVGVGLHNVGIAKLETSLPACECVWGDQGDYFVHRLNHALEIQGRRCWWTDASEQRTHVDLVVRTVAIHSLFSRLNCGLVSRAFVNELMPPLATIISAEPLL